MVKKHLDITGVKFSRLTPLYKTERRKNRTYWLCRCECGNQKEVSRDRIVSGHTRSCGCLVDDTPPSQLKHGLSNSPEYQAWAGAKQRCYLKTSKRYPIYGGRGITMADEWIDDFSAFFAHVGPRPSKLHSLDRIDTDKGYAPGNVRWVTQKEQCRNKRNNKIVEINGERKCAAAWCEENGIHQGTAHSRVKSGIPAEIAYTQKTI